MRDAIQVRMFICIALAVFPVSCEKHFQESGELHHFGHFGEVIEDGIKYMKLVHGNDSSHFEVLVEDSFLRKNGGAIKFEETQVTIGEHTFALVNFHRVKVSHGPVVEVIELPLQSMPDSATRSP